MDTEDDRIRQMQGALQLLQTGIDRSSKRVEEMHIAISRKPFDVLRLIPVIGTAAGVVERLHDGITHGVHLGIRAASDLAIGTAIHALEFAKMDGPLDDEAPRSAEPEPKPEPEPAPPAASPKPRRRRAAARPAAGASGSDAGKDGS